MENNELHKIWKNVDSSINLKTIDDLNKSLSVKTRQTINKFLLILIIDIIVCTGFIVFLTITALKRHGDVIYLVNNSALCLITVVSLIVSIFSLIKLQNNRFNLPLKEWVEQRIKMLSGWLTGKLSRIYIFLLPVLLVMINLSIHVYYERTPFIEVLKDTESIIGLIVGFPIGLLVSFFAVNKIRKYQMKNLEFLRYLYIQLCNEP